MLKRVTDSELLSPQFIREGAELIGTWTLSPLEQVVAEYLINQSLIERLCRIFMQGINGGKRAKQERLITTALKQAAQTTKVHVFLLIIRAFANGYSFVECRSAPKGGIRISKKVAHSVDKAIRAVCGSLLAVARKHDGTSALRRLKKELVNAYLGQDSVLVRARDEGLKAAAAANV